MRFILFALSIVALLPSLTSADHGDNFTVLFAQNHNEVYDLEGQDLLSLQRFALLLIDQGVSVLSLNQGEIREEVLKGVDVLVLSFPLENLTKGEIKSITRYIGSGGGLLVLGGQRSRDYLNPLLIEFGMEMGFGVVQFDGNLDLLLQAGDHEVFDFVEKFEYNHAPAVRVTDSNWIIYKSPTFSEDWALFASRDYGKGRVFVSGDADFLNDHFLDGHDNAQLGYNIVLYTGRQRPVKLTEEKRSYWVALLIVALVLALLLIKQKLRL